MAKMLVTSMMRSTARRNVAAAGACAAGANQPNMQAAIGSLQAARAELLRAPANKGGHRDRAIQFVDSAISETRAGIAYAGN